MNLLSASTSRYKFPLLSIKSILKCKPQHPISISGWIKTIRLQKNVAFAQISDGSESIQAVFNSDANLKHLSTGSSVTISGILVNSIGVNQEVELSVSSVQLLGNAAPEVYRIPKSQSYPLSKSKLPLDYLREIPHLRSRSRCFESLWRIRNTATMQVHSFLQSNEFLQIHAPVITSSDCEGGGEQFQIAKTEKEFFGKPSYLTVSSQLHLEAAINMSRIYSFGPTFRAEKSKTSRHLAEFWMLEVEMAFIQGTDLLLDFIEGLLKHTIQGVLDTNQQDLSVMAAINRNRIDLKRLLTPFDRITYTEAIQILSRKTWDAPIKWGMDLQSQHERYLAETHFKGPVFVTDYPAAIKPFYMRKNEDGKTVACCDLLVPGVGELVGGSVREERLELLNQAIMTKGLDQQEYSWYLDTRRFGTVPHAGFGCGFERLLQLISGMQNVRDCIPFPRYTDHCLQ